MAADVIQTEDSPVWKAKCGGSTTHPVGGAGSALHAITIRGAHGVTRTTQRNLSGRELSRRANERAMPTQEFSRGHSPFSFKLHFGERKCAFAGGNDQVFVAAQDVPGLAIEVDN